MKNSNPVGWFEIYVQDMARARTFYQTVLDIDMPDLPMDNEEGFTMVMFGSMENDPDGSKPGAHGALVHMPGMPSGNNSTIVYFNSEDCAVEEARAAEAGGTVFKEKFSIGEYGFISLCTDPDGNMFGLHSQS